MIWRTLIALAAALLASSAEAARMTIYEIGPGQTAVFINGVIEPGDGAKFTRTIMDKTAGAARRDLVSVILNSPGGNLHEGHLIAAEVKIARLSSYVPPDSVCASACFLIAASAGRKHLHGQIGIHGASADGVETPVAMAATMSMARVLAARGLPSSVVGRMVTTPASDMVWLSSVELASIPGYVPPRRPGEMPSIYDIPR